MAGGGVVFLIVYLSCEKSKSISPSEKNQQGSPSNSSSSGIGHQRRCSELKSLIEKNAAKNKEKVTVTLQPFCEKENLFALVDANKPDIIVFDVREKIEAKVFSQLKQKGFFLFLLDSDDEQAIRVVDYHVRTLPYLPSLDVKKKTMANLFGPTYLPIELVKKNAVVQKRKTKKILVYLGSFSARRELLQSYLEQFQKTVLLEKFWLADSNNRSNSADRSGSASRRSAHLKEIDFQWTFVVEGNASHRKEVKYFFLRGMQGCLKKNQKNSVEVFGILDQKKNLPAD